MSREKGIQVKREIRRWTLIAVLLSVCLLLAPAAYAAEGYDQVASGAEQASSKPVISYGMVPVRAQDVKDGSYEIEVRSSSKFFRIEKAVLQVKDGKMGADLTLSSTSYKYIFLGTAEEAAKAPQDAYIEVADEDGWGRLQMDVSGLDEEIPCAAFSKRKKHWYDRTILFEAGSLPEDTLKIKLPDYDKIEKAVEQYESGDSAESASEAGPSDPKAGSSGAYDADYLEPAGLKLKDGEYSIQVVMTGGSGRASVTSPTWLIAKDGKAFAKLLWSSTYYDYMIVGGEKILNETTDGGNSTFTIPVAAFDEPVPVIADTTAMGDPVEIEYELTFYKDSIGSKNQIPQEAATNVLIVALIIIALGGVLNIVLKRRKKQ